MVAFGSPTTRSPRAPVRDQVASGAAKALVLVGRVVSEEPGMAACAEWVKTVAPGVGVTHVGAGDLYWRPTR